MTATRIGHGGIHVPGANGVNRDVIRQQFDSQGACQAKYTMFGSSICCDILVTNTGSDRSDVNDTPPALLFQPRRESLGYIVDALEVDTKHTRPGSIGMVKKFVA